MTLRYYIDTEFHEYERPLYEGFGGEDSEETVPTIELISLALVCEDGRELYRVSSEYDKEAARANPFLNLHVLPHLWSHDPRGRARAEKEASSGPVSYVQDFIPQAWDRAHIRKDVMDFIADGCEFPEFWGYYSDYDWVVFCWLFGRMIDLPKGFPMFCLDIKQLAHERGDVQLPKDPDTHYLHNALLDVRWVRDSHRFLLKGEDHEDRYHRWRVEQPTPPGMNPDIEHLIREAWERGRGEAP